MKAISIRCHSSSLIKRFSSSFSSIQRDPSLPWMQPTSLLQKVISWTSTKQFIALFPFSMGILLNVLFWGFGLVGVLLPVSVMSMVLPQIRALVRGTAILIYNISDGFVWSGIGDSTNVSPLQQFLLVFADCPIIIKCSLDQTRLPLAIPSFYEAFLQSADSKKNRGILSPKG